jgi:hypothetical protein
VCIWMDVDLESSSREAMAVFPYLPPLSCVFSHEWSEENFSGDRIIAPRGPESVIPPIVAAFGGAGRRVTGRFIGGQTGCFWDIDRGIPPLPTPSLLRLRDLAIDAA